jgi:hypothetical protein
MQFLLDVVTNILANIIFWIGFGAISWIAIRISQRAFARFFGISTNRNIQVYVSNLSQPQLDMPEKFSLSEHEFRAVEAINRLFGSTPFRLPEIIRGLVDSFWLGSMLIVETKVSPVAISSVSLNSNLIVIGGAPRNVVRRYYLTTRSSYLIFGTELPPSHPAYVDKPIHVVVMKGQKQGNKIEGDYNLAIIEKLYDPEHRITIFLCTGNRGDSSWGATEYLVRHWRELSQIFDSTEFAICLGFSQTETYMRIYQEPSILARFPH